MYDIKTFTQTPIHELQKMAVGGSITLLTYKKDRRIILCKVDADAYRVTEDGFEHTVFENVPLAQLVPLLKQLKLIEFPRSRTYFMTRQNPR